MIYGTTTSLLTFLWATTLLMHITLSPNRVADAFALRVPAVAPRTSTTTSLPHEMRMTAASPEGSKGDDKAAVDGFATKEQVLDALKKSERAVLLDVRGVDEIMKAGYLKADQGASGCSHQWLNVPWNMMPFATQVLDVAAEDMLPLVEYRTIPILVYCASGKRASLAKKILEGKGYGNVLNLGGYADVDYLTKTK